MNAMTEALVVAGVKVPTVRVRIFNWLKDHPEKTAEDIQKGLGLEYAPAQAIRNLELEGAIKAYSDKGRNGYHIKRYSVAVKVLSVTDTGRALAKARKPAAKAEIVPAVVPVVHAPAPEWTPAQVVDPLTLPQAKAVYAYLHQFFGGV